LAVTMAGGAAVPAYGAVATATRSAPGPPSITSARIERLGTRFAVRATATRPLFFYGTATASSGASVALRGPFGPVLEAELRPAGALPSGAAFQITVEGEDETGQHSAPAALSGVRGRMRIAIRAVVAA